MVAPRFGKRIGILRSEASAAESDSEPATTQAATRAKFVTASPDYCGVGGMVQNGEIAGASATAHSAGARNRG